MKRAKLSPAEVAGPWWSVFDALRLLAGVALIALSLLESPPRLLVGALFMFVIVGLAVKRMAVHVLPPGSTDAGDPS